VVHVSEARVFDPALEVLARRAVAANLVAGGVEDGAEFYDFVVRGFAAVFAVGKGVEVLQLYPAARRKITGLWVSVRLRYEKVQVQSGGERTRRTGVAALASLVCCRACNGCG